MTGLKRRRWIRRSAAGAFVLAGFVSAGTARAQEEEKKEQEPPRQKEEVRVVAPTPVDGMPVDSMHFPGNFQHLEVDAGSRATGATEPLSRSLGSVNLSGPQGNALEPDVFYRGFEASPLLGTPQGISVYQDGVRLNETFGDTVHWALVPPGALKSMDLVPGSDPLFGQNTIGGSVSLHTKTGFDTPGTVATISGGSFGRRGAALETGGHRGAFAWFLAGDGLAEDGWRRDSESRLSRVFADGSWRSGERSMDLTLQASSDRIGANGTVPESLLESDRSAVFTRPDLATTRDGLVAWRGRFPLSPSTALLGNVSARWTAPESSNGDATPFFPCTSPPGLLCSEAPEGPRVVLDQNGKPVPAGSDAVINRTRATETDWSATLQLEAREPLFGLPNRLVAGVAAEDGRTRYESSVEIASFDSNLVAAGSGLFAADSAVRVKSARTNLAAFVSDALSLSPTVTLTAGGRFDHSRTSLFDQIGTALDGRHELSRFNPMAGLTWQFSPERVAFAGYSEAIRAPTPVELTCADPEAPCRLPNAFTSDPPLSPVLARTLEAGLRGRERFAAWSVALFRTTTDDDILFVANGAGRGTGHFENVGRSRRQGIEVNASGSAGIWSWFLDYSYLDARFESSFLESSPDHPDSEDGSIFVPAGSRFPSVPLHNAKAGAWVRVARSWEAGVEAVVLSGQFLRGDEANLLAPLRPQFRVGFDVQYQATASLTLFLKVTNVFDRRDADFGQVGNAQQVLGDAFSDYRFVNPAAPRLFRAGIQVRL